MKRMTKFSLLLLSLALLIGVFAVTALAEGTNVATVVYPDGSTETVAVGSVITPKAFTDGLYYGEGNTLYKDDATEGWSFTVEGEEAALADLTVTEAMVGKNIIASGADKVYYSIKISGEYTYNTSAETYANDLRELLRNTPKAQTVTFYSDVSLAATYTYGGSSNTLYIDLNGHKWTITGKASDKTADGKTESSANVAFDCSSNIYIYSTVKGAIVDVPTAAAFFRTNDKTINSTKCYGYLRIGEKNLTDKNVNGQNLTVYCKQINPDMYSSNALILGGTYIQRENSTAKYFLLLSRTTAPGQSHFTYSTTVTEIRNATFIVTKSGTSPMYWTHKSMSFTNCNFINTTDTYVPLMAETSAMTSSGTIGTPTFSGCNFYNVIPAKRLNYTKSDGSAATHTVTYTNCSFGFSDAVPGDDLDIADSTVMHLANAATVVNKEIAGKTYAMNAKLITSTANVLALDWGIGVDYWEIGAKPSREAGEGSMIENGILYSAPVFDLGSLSQIDENGYVISAGSAEVGVVFSKADALALSYENTVTKEFAFVLQADVADAAALGDKFYELFHAPDSAYYITLYQNITITKGVPFGKLTTGSQPQYNSLANGNITLDLNGYTLSVSESITGLINPSNSNADIYNGVVAAVFGLEGTSNKTFTLKSSVPGAKVVNPTAYTFICIGERDSNRVVIEGENLVIDSVGTIVGNVEVAAVALTVTDGAYIYRGDKIPFISAGTVNVSGAKIVLTNKSAQAVFALPTHQHCSTVYTVSDIEVYAQGNVKLVSYAGNQTFNSQSSQTKDDGVTNNLSFADCTLVGVKIIGAMAGTNSITYSGDIVADSMGNLAVAIPEAPEGMIPVFNVIAYDGVTYKVVSYKDASNAGLVNWGFGLAEYWALGAIATHENAVVDGVFGYTFAPVEVVAGVNNAKATLVTYKPGMLRMSLTLQSKIGLNVFIAESLANATVTINGELYALSDASGGYFRLEKTLAPNVADEAILIEITIGDNTHAIPVSVGSYANAILTSEEADYVAAQDLTYAMVAYISTMSKNAELLASLPLPEGYEEQTLVAAPSGNVKGLLESIAFQLDGTIAIALKSTSAASGMTVTLKLATGRVETATIDGTQTIFEGLYVNEFHGDMTISVGNETYTYNLANYMYGLTEAEDKLAVQALYNYAFHAEAYVDLLQEQINVPDRTLDASEQARMRDGILALMYSENIAPIKLLKDMYLVAFSESPTLASTPAGVLDGIFSTSEEATPVKMRAMVVPGLYGGSAVDASLNVLFRGERKVAAKADLIIGDLLFVTAGSQTNAYIFDGSVLISVMNGCSVADTDAVLASLANASRYAVLRPSITLATLRYAGPQEDIVLTDAQIALIETAKAYLQRGYRQQYDDTSMGANSEYRWQIGQFAPEDYTSQKWGYLNCAAFTYECYRNALGMDLGSRYTTNALCKYYLNGGKVGAAEYPYYYSNSLNVAQSDRIAEQEKFMSELVPGDLVVILREGGYGHVMMYIGNGVLVHSSGSSFAYSDDSETYEPTIRYMNVLGYLFNPDSTNYLFREVEKSDGSMRPYIETLAIVRPLDSFGGEIPENTQNRVENLGGILAEKLSSAPEGMTVNPGAPITFTFRIKNNGLAAKTLEIKDYIPENATLLSAGDFTYADGVLSVSVTVEAGATVEVSYTVTASGELGSKIHGKNATVGGVLHTCPATYIEKTLTEAEQAALIAAAAQFKASNPDGLKGVNLVNAIYLAAGLEAPFAEVDDIEDVKASLFESVTVSGSSLWQLSEESEYYSMVAPTLYGGRKYYTPQRYNSTTKVNTDRSRLPREQALVVGDLVVVKFGSSEGLYFYLGGDSFVSVSSASMANDSRPVSERLMRMMSVGNYYAILRPSMK